MEQLAKFFYYSAAIRTRVEKGLHRIERGAHAGKSRSWPKNTNALIRFAMLMALVSSQGCHREGDSPAVLKQREQNRREAELEDAIFWKLRQADQTASSGDYVTANRLFANITSQHPGRIYAWRQRAVTAWLAKMTDEQCLTIVREGIRNYDSLEEAERDYRRDDLIGLLEVQGRVQLRQKDSKGAEVTGLKMIQCDDQNWCGYKVLSLAEEQQGEFAAAMKHADKAIELGDDRDQQLINLKKRLRNELREMGFQET